MSEKVLIKHGYKRVFATQRFVAYQLDKDVIVIWKDSVKVYKV